MLLYKVNDLTYPWVSVHWRVVEVPQDVSLLLLSSHHHLPPSFGPGSVDLLQLVRVNPGAKDIFILPIGPGQFHCFDKDMIWEDI